MKAKVNDLEKALCKLQSQHSETIELFNDTKKALRDAELNCNKLYKDISSTNAKHVEKVHESQQKFEEASLLIARQSAMIDDLNGQIEKLKEVNTQIEFSWAEKYRDMAEVKDEEYSRMKRDLKDQLDKERRTHAEKVKQLLADFKADMATVESTHNKRHSDQKHLSSKTEAKVKKQEQAIEELKNLLQMAVKSDQRKDALL